MNFGISVLLWIVFKVLYVFICNKLDYLANFFFLLQKHKSSSGHLTQEECEKIMKELIKPENFSTGNNAIKILLCLYGFPICALFAKRMIPAMKSISDDVVIPAATSASVAFLCTTHKL